MLYIKRHVLDIRILTSAYYKAADANHDGTVSSIDMLYVKRHVLDIRYICLLYTSPSPRDLSTSRMPSSA